MLSAPLAGAQACGLAPNEVDQLVGRTIDAYVRFSEDYAAHISGFSMRAVSASTDFSYDFQDLDFQRAAAH